MSDCPLEPIRLNEGDSDDSSESIPLNPHDNDHSGESISLNQQETRDPRESIRLNLTSDDPRDSMRLDQYFSDLGYTRKIQVRNDIIFTTSAVGLIQLSNVVYNKLCEISPRFAECVSSSMFIYYVGQLYYMRLCLLECEVVKTDSDDFCVMKNMILRKRWIVPQLLAYYFNSIGSFRDFSGIPAHHREIVFPCNDDIEGINGFFGRIDSNTHTHYENRISPGVTAWRIVEDLVFTLHSSRRLKKGYWDLPKALVPAEKNAGKPTANLLGWNFATSLTSEQVRILYDCGVFSCQGRIKFSHCTRFCHNNQLMNRISDHLNELRGRVKCVERLSAIPTGSITQHDFQIVNALSLFRSRVYGDIGTINCGVTPLHMHKELLAHAFRLRIVRRKIPQADGKTLNPWCCYDFETYKKVPDSWYMTSNTYFFLGRLKMWDIGWYRTQPADLTLLLNGLMDKTLIH